MPISDQNIVKYYYFFPLFKYFKDKLHVGK